MGTAAGTASANISCPNSHTCPATFCGCSLVFHIGSKSPTQAWYVQQRSNQSTILLGQIASERRNTPLVTSLAVDRRPLVERLGLSLLPAPDFLLPHHEGLLRSIAVHNGQISRQACEWDHPLRAFSCNRCLCCSYRLHSCCRTLHDEDVRCDPGYTREIVERSLAVTAIYTHDTDQPDKGEVTVVKASWGCWDQQSMPYPKLPQQLPIIVLVRKWHSSPQGLLLHPTVWKSLQLQAAPCKAGMRTVSGASTAERSTNHDRN